jgi:murein DD-endopeptidase MepM/ murein hydrolase activator NlpD
MIELVNNVAQSLVLCPCGMNFLSQTFTRLAAPSLVRRTAWALAISLLTSRLAIAQLAPTSIRTVLLPSNTSLQLKTGVIEDNVFVSLSRADVPDEVALTMMRELSQTMNLDTGVKAGDRFAVLYDKPPLGGARNNKLLAFEYTSGATVYAAYWFEQGSQTGFYQEDGVGLRPAYLRTPLEVVRVTSTFGARQHPVRRTWLAHEGTDFAAPTGTRVFASGDGEVTFIGAQNGFGKVIKLKHPKDTQTVYAHLSAFSTTLRLGDTVKQGDVIGFVGRTGWATGPHLHYEYRVANKPVDPFSTSLPTNNRISSDNADRFATQLTVLKSHFSLVRKPAMAAIPADIKPTQAE